MVKAARARMQCRRNEGKIEDSSQAVFRHTREYRHTLSKLGLEVHSRPLSLDTFPPLRIITARKQP